MTLKEEYQKKIDLVNKLLKDRKSTGKSDESNKELRELKTKVSRLEELLSEKGINLTDN